MHTHIHYLPQEGAHLASQATKLKVLIKAIWVLNWFNSCGFAELVPMVGSRWDMEGSG